jgi:hypothetical protein
LNVKAAKTASNEDYFLKAWETLLGGGLPHPKDFGTECVGVPLGTALKAT